MESNDTCFKALIRLICCCLSLDDKILFTAVRNEEGKLKYCLLSLKSKLSALKEHKASNNCEQRIFQDAQYLPVFITTSLN